MQRIEHAWSNAAVAFATLVGGVILYAIISDALARLAGLL